MCGRWEFVFPEYLLLAACFSYVKNLICYRKTENGIWLKILQETRIHIYQRFSKSLKLFPCVIAVNDHKKLCLHGVFNDEILIRNEEEIRRKKSPSLSGDPVPGQAGSSFPSYFFFIPWIASEIFLHQYNSPQEVQPLHQSSPIYSQSSGTCFCINRGVI